jgi:hypothetical protein
MIQKFLDFIIITHKLKVKLTLNKNKIDNLPCSDKKLKPKSLKLSILSRYILWDRELCTKKR